MFLKNLRQCGAESREWVHLNLFQQVSSAFWRHLFQTGMSILQTQLLSTRQESVCVCLCVCLCVLCVGLFKM